MIHFGPRLSDIMKIFRNSVKRHSDLKLYWDKEPTTVYKTVITWQSGDMQMLLCPIAWPENHVGGLELNPLGSS